MASAGNSHPLPAFLRLTGHEVRWRLLTELARSDRRVRELMDRIGEPQNVLSYHLAKLRAAGMVTTRRSSADGRDVYYHLDLDRAAELLAETAAALHPGLRHELRPVGPVGPVRVLFLCTGNSARSPVAAALLRHHGGAGVVAESAGTNPKPLHPYAAQALRERGVEPGEHHPRHVDTMVGHGFDYVISLCDRVREVCPEFPDHPALIHWSIPNPSEPDPGDDPYEVFRRTIAELDTRVRFFLATVDACGGAGPYPTR